MPEKKSETAVASRGFTLVELMVVMLIISLLVSIILPSLGNARTLARTTKTRGLFHALDVGIESFHDNQILGNDNYPPSTWDTGGTLGGDPYGNSDTYVAPGAETLFWALTGADQLGSPGFRGELHNDADGGLYHLDSSGQPEHARVTFIEPSQAEILEVEDTVNTSRSVGPYVYIDAFKGPVLYYRAAPSAAQLDIYERDDNEGLIEGDPDDHPLADTISDTLHGVSVTEAFEKFVWNSTIPAQNLYRPHNAESYILISAGPDKEFGTKDDITNYPLTIENY